MLHRKVVDLLRKSLAEAGFNGRADFGRWTLDFGLGLGMRLIINLN
jgi:hypothetical protein